jgi:hypothetical protein
MEKQTRTLTTTSIDQQAYSEQRAQFLQDYFKFRRGEFKAGLDALNHLTSMFYCLPATRYFTQDEPAAMAFLKRIDDFDEALESYPSEHGDITGVVRNPKLIKEMDSLLREFYKIMNVCGYSR